MTENCRGHGKSPKTNKQNKQNLVESSCPIKTSPAHLSCKAIVALLNHFI